MSDNQVHEMITAYALGCMDKENFKMFKEYISSGGELPQKELGEFQNIIALIPTVMELETPHPKLKAKVAKRLKSYQDEIKSKIREQKKTKLTRELHNESKTRLRYTEEITEEKLRYEAPKKPEKNKEPKITYQPKVKKQFITIGAVLLFVLSIILTFYLNYSSGAKIEELTKGLDEVKSENALLKKELLQTKNFVENYSDLIKFIGTNEISIVKMVSTIKTEEVWGKLLVTFELGEALLEIHNPPKLGNNELFSLWITSKGKTYHLSSFKPTLNSIFYKVQGLPYIKPKDIDLFRLTIETAGEREAPEGKTILIGSLKRKGK